MINPAKGYVLVEIVKKKKKSAIYLSEEEEKKRNDFVIRAIGDEESQFKKGQKIIFDPKAIDLVNGFKDEDDEKEYWIVHEAAIIATRE